MWRDRIAPRRGRSEKEELLRGLIMQSRKIRQRQRHRHNRRLAGERLESRELLSGIITVTSTADSGPNTLRAAITQADNHVGSIIDFAIKTGPLTITLAKPLPAITVPITIDGTSQPGYGTTPLVTVDGSDSGATSVGFDFQPGSSGSAILGLEITGFHLAGIRVAGASQVTIGGATLGQGNVISGNPGTGILLTEGQPSIPNGGLGPPKASDRAVIEGNLIGIDVAGSAQPNGTGVAINAAANNTIGGNTAAERNVISGNLGDGIDISGSDSPGNLVSGNDIGTGLSGTAAVANGGAGIVISSGTSDNTIGGKTAAERNVISGNTADGINIVGPSTTGNEVAGNDIGTNSGGTAAVANGGAGIVFSDGAIDNTVGGSTALGNVVSGNSADGIDVVGSAMTGPPTSGIAIADNFIGTNASGTSAVANGGAGIAISGGATNNTIGGGAAAGNVISGNTADGVDIVGPATTGIEVAGNDVGTNSGGTTAVPNGGAGIAISGGATNNTVGGSTASATSYLETTATASTLQAPGHQGS